MSEAEPSQSRGDSCFPYLLIDRIGEETPEPSRLTGEFFPAPETPMDSKLSVALVALVALLALGGAYFLLTSEPETPPLDTPGPRENAGIHATPSAGDATNPDIDPVGLKPVETSEFRGEELNAPDAAKGGTKVSGRVVNPRGRGIHDARVTLIRNRSVLKTQLLMGQALWSEQTKDNGTFTLAVPPGGSYILEVSHPDYSRALAHPIDPKQPSTLTQEIHLLPGLGFKGTITMEAGGPVENALVVVYDKSSTNTAGERIEREIRSGPDGRYEVRGLTAGMKKVIVSKEGLSTDGRNGFMMTEGRPIPDLDFLLGQGYSIRGRVVEGRSGVPIKGATVSSRPLSLLDSGAVRRRAPNTPVNEDDHPNGQGLRSAVHRPSVAAHSLAFLNLSTKTDANGVFDLKGLVNARYNLTTVAEGFQTFHGTSANSGDTDVQIELVPSPRIIGRCIDAETAKPLPQFEVAISASPAIEAFPAAAAKYVQHPDGAFTLFDLRPGDFYVLVKAHGYAGGIAGPFTVTPEALIDGVVVEVSKGCTVTGRVTDVQNKPVAGAFVSLKRQVAGDNDRSAQAFLDLLSRQMSRSSLARTTTDAQGNWSIGGVSAGTYTVNAECTGFTPGSSAPFTCENKGEANAPTISLEPGARVYGVITLEDGKPDAKATVMITATEGIPPFSSSAQTNTNGEFEFSDLKAGSYRLLLVQRAGVLDIMTMLQGRNDNTNMVTVKPGDDIKVTVQPPAGGR